MQENKLVKNALIKSLLGDAGDLNKAVKNLTDIELINQIGLHNAEYFNTSKDIPRCKELYEERNKRLNLRNK